MMIYQCATMEFQWKVFYSRNSRHKNETLNLSKKKTHTILYSRSISDFLLTIDHILLLRIDRKQITNKQYAAALAASLTTRAATTGFACPCTRAARCSIRTSPRRACVLAHCSCQRVRHQPIRAAVGVVDAAHDQGVLGSTGVERSQRATVLSRVACLVTNASKMKRSFECGWIKSASRRMASLQWSTKLLIKS